MPFTAPKFTQRVPVQFISDDNPSISITTTQNVLQNNPSAIKVLTGSNVKIDQDIDGNAHYRGDGEAPPFAIQLEWKILSYTDYLNMSALRPYFVTFVTHRNLGYYGKLVLDGPESIMSSADTVHATGTFYPLTPSDDGGAQSVLRIPNPTNGSFVVNGNGAGTGAIQSGVTQYYCLTFSTQYGETLYATNTWSPTGSNVSSSLSWSWPSSPNCQFATIYNCAGAGLGSPRIVAQIPSAMASSWTDYVGYSGLTVGQALPSASTAYDGKWKMGIWYNRV